MTTSPIQHQPLQQTPVHLVPNHSEQARRIAVLAIGVLTSAVILAAMQPPASIILASIVMISTLSIALDSGDHPISESTTTEKTVYVMRERFSPLWHWRNFSFPSRSDRVPVGTGERNTLPTSRNYHTVMRHDPILEPSSCESRPEPLVPKQTYFEHDLCRASTSIPTSWNREPVGRRESSHEPVRKEPIMPKDNLTSTDRVPVGRR